MPTISISLKYFNKISNLQLDADKFENACFDFGVEVERDDKDVDSFKVEIAANRYDLLCVEGLAAAMSNYTACPSSPFLNNIT